MTVVANAKPNPKESGTEKKHKHTLQFLHTETVHRYEGAPSMSVMMVEREFAYFWCKVCENVIKKEVINE